MTRLQSVQRAKANWHAGKTVASFDTLGVPSVALTQTITEMSFGTVWKTASLSLRLIGGILIIFLGITGCADVPYTGPILKVSDVEKFLNSRDENAACVDDGFDSVCIKVIRDGETDRPEDSDAPVIHVHPTSLSYLFYYAGEPILLAERAMDTTQIVQELIDAGKIQAPIGGNVWSDNNDSNIPDVWVVQIYYPNSLRQVNRRLRSWDIRVVEGSRIRRDSRWDLEIKEFTRDGNSSAQFFIETEATQIAIEIEGLIPDAHGYLNLVVYVFS